MLSYLGRHEDAIRRSTELLQTPYLPGDAYYWRAWNEDKLDRLDEAWADVEHAERLWRNSDVFKLAGLVAYKRHELEIAQLRFNTSLALNPDDCEARFYLASVQVDLAAWPSAADSFAVSAMCLDGTQSRLAAEVERLRRSDGRPDRIARQIARREAERATTLRLLAQSWFNGAVSNLHLDRQDDARRLAEKLVDDEQFGARAKEILSRLR
jgi:tetratricopeptide (TPR) repeat protein